MWWSAFAKMRSRRCYAARRDLQAIAPDCAAADRFIAEAAKQAPGADANDLLSNGVLQPFNYASDSLGAQSDGWHRSNFLRTHSLPEVEPENHSVALLIGPCQATLEVLIDLIQKDSESDPFLAPGNLFSGLGLDISGGNMRVATAG